MSFPYQQNESLDQYEDESMPKLQLRHSPFSSNKLGPSDKAIFESKDIATHADPFDIVAPGCGIGDAFLSMQNPPLLAFRNKTLKNAYPSVTSPNAPRKPPHSQIAQSSLLSRRPLTALKDPEIHSLDIVRRQIEQEKLTINLQEDPVAYFSKRKDGRGHRFIYLVYKGDPHDPYFSPYELDKVPFAEIKGGYFTMSATGVTHVYPDGTTETTSLDLWAQEKSIFNSIRKLKTFAQFFFWKPFRIWKNFVMHQRYSELDTTIMLHPFFRNKEFFSRALFLYNRQSIARELLHKFLLAFHSQRKFRLEEFEGTNKSNIEHLKLKFEKFINKTQFEVLTLYTTISNPKLVQVHDSDFPDIKRRNPNLAQLMVLEKRKAAKRAAKTEAVNRQIIEIGGFIRLIDYMLLESIAEGCIEAWKIAEQNVASEQASVFVVDVLFDSEGKVSFKPTLEVLLDSVKTILHESLKTLNMLPRLLMQLQLKPFLRDNGLDYVRLFEQGPQFQQIVHKEILDKIRDNIVHIVTVSYREGFEISQSFANFYPIYRMGQTWNVRDYLITKENKRYEGQLTEEAPEGISADDFLLKPELQPIIDFQRVSNDIKQFREDKKRVENMRNGAVRGALFIDSRGLKAILTPIPQKSLVELQDLLTKLSALKMEKLKNALRYYSRQLKQEPQTLDDYVSFCAILERCSNTTPQISAEIEFVDNLYEMFDKFGFPHEENSNHTLFTAFTQDKATAATTRTEHLGIFTEALKMSLGETEAKINKFHEKATSIPAALKDADVNTCLPSAKKLCIKIDELKPKVTELLRQQKIMRISLNEFTAYETVKTAAAFAVKLYEAVGQWHELSNMMTKVPFNQINTEKFKNDVEALKEAAVKLQASAPNNYPILNELLSKIQETHPFVEQLEQLSHGKMQLRHWNMLFESCNHKDDYHQDITIEELLNFGILRAKDKIEEITATSQGESELEAEFIQIMNHWNKVQMPLAETQIKMEDTLLLGPTDPLLAEIQDTLATLARMLALPYVQGIRESVSSLSSNLENLSLIIEAWQLFQSNWIVLSALFAIEEARNVLPHQANRFTSVQRKWSNVARHTLKDTRLFSVCAYPSLLEVLKENNAAMELILASLGKFLDAKRQATPRLFFLGNEEVLTFATTTNFSQFTSILAKLFMHVAKIDCHEHDGAEGEASFASNNLQRLKIYGLIGEDGDSIQFQRHVQCGSSMESWISQLIETMKTTVKDGIAASVPGCQSGSFVDWVMTTPTYIAFISLNVVFCNEMEDCFATYESNPRAFQQYESILKRRIEDMSDSFLLPLSAHDEHKLNVILTQLLGFRDRFKAATEKIQNHSPYLEWLHSLRFRFLPNSASISVEFSDYKWDHGYEYWGKTPCLIHTPTVDSALSDCIYCFAQNQLPILTSSASSAKQSIGTTLACLFGLYAYVVRPFPDMTEYFLSRILTGVVSSGALAIFNGIENLSNKSLCCLFDNAHSIITALAAGNPRITISSRLADLNKNCRILLTADSNFGSCENIPPQLKSYVRPISLLAPTYSKIIEIHLTSIGFRETKIITPKFASFIQSAHSMFSHYLPNLALGHRIITICKKANEMIHKMRVTLTEDMAIALYSYDSFAVLCDEAKTDILLNMLYNAFQIGSGPDELLEKMKAIKKESVEAQLRSAVEKEVSSLALELPNNYLANQVLTLYNLMQQYNCVIIVGPSNSGKSTILEVLKRAFDRSETRSAFPNDKPMNILPLFHMSDKWPKIYGDVYEDINVGTMYAYGEIQSAIYHLYEDMENTHQILKFDGKLTKSFSTFISEFFGSPSSNKMILNSLDSFQPSRNFHVVIETDNLGNATPSLLSKCGILVMKNLQSSLPFLSQMPPSELVHPSIPFARALKACFDCIDQTNVQVIRSVFCEVAPVIVTRVYHLKNTIYSTEIPTVIENGHILLGEILPMYSGILSMKTIDHAGIKQSDEDQVRMCVIISFARIFNGILYNEEISSFNVWLCTQFNIEMPKDWVGFTVAPSFSECFDRPLLISMRMHQGKLIPLSSSDLEKPPIYQRIRAENETTDDDSKNSNDDEITKPTKLNSSLPLFVDEISVIHPQILPAIHICTLLMMSRQNLIIHGPIDAGKSSFLPIIFNEMPGVEPIIISASKFLNGESIISYLSTHTLIISKSKNSSTTKNFVLVFDGIETSHSELMEFIRMIITTHKIPRFSPNDQKVFEFAELFSFSVIVTTRNYNELPSRFLSYFAPVTLSSITETTSQFIGSKILQTYGYNTDVSDKMMKASMMILSQYSHMSAIHSIASICSSLCFIEDKNDLNTTIYALLHEIFYVSLHKYPKDEFIEKVASIFKEDFSESSEVVDKFLLFDDLRYPTFEVVKDSIKTTVKPHPINSLKDELKYYLQLFNTNSIEKISMRFSNVTTREWDLIFRTLSRPGHNAILRGKDGSGRYVMSRFAAHMTESDFILISSTTPEESISPSGREESILEMLRTVITNAVVNQKKSVVYIRANKYNEREVRFIADFASKLCFVSYFSEQELADLYEKALQNKQAVTTFQKEKTRKLIVNLLKLQVHTIININDNLGYSINYNCFDEIVFESDLLENYESVSGIALENQTLKNIIGDDKESTLLLLLPKISDIARKFTSTFCPNKFYDFVDSFSHFLLNDSKDIETKNKNILSALNFVKNLKEDSLSVNKRLENLSPTLQRLQVDSESLQSSYNTRKEAIETRKQKLEVEHKERTEEVEELDKHLAEHSAERTSLTPIVDQAFRDVEKLTDNDIETIRITAADPQPALRLLLEMFCIFLDLTPSYERSGQKLLMGPQFVQTIISKINGNTITPALIEKVQPYFENPEMTAQSLEAIAPALKSLYDWIDSLCKMAKLNDDLKNEKLIIDEKHRQLNDYIEEMNLEISSIEQVEKTLEGESKSLVESNKSREQMEKEYQLVDQRKKSIDSIFKGIEVLTKKWDQESGNFAQTYAKLIGNTIIFAFYLVFCGSMKIDDRKTSLLEVVDLLKTAGLDTSYADPLQSVTERFMTAHSLSGESSGAFDSTTLDYHHVATSLRTPLLIDPDGIVTNMYTSSVPLKKLITVSQSISTLDQMLATAISEGKTLVLGDCDYLHPLVSSVLNLMQTTPDQNTSLNIKIGAKLVTWDTKFRLVLTSRKSNLSEFPMSLLSRVTVIDTSESSLIATQSAFERSFIDFFDPDLAPKLVEMKKEETGHRVQTDKYERDTLDILADVIATQASKPDYDYLSDENTVTDLIRSKECFIKALNTPPDHATTRKQLKTMIEPFRRHIQLCQIFWKVMSRDLPLVNESAQFSFASYQKQIASIISNGGLHPGTLSAEQHSALNLSISNSTFQVIFQSLPISDALFFMFMTAFSIKEVAKSVQQSDLRAVLDHIMTECDKSADLQGDDVAVGDNFEHLKFANIVYIFKYMIKFIAEQYGEEYQSLLPFFQFDSVITNAASTPTLVLANEKFNPSSLIQHFVGLRLRHENLSIVSLCDDLDLIRNTRKMITSSQNRGNWVIVHYYRPSKAAASMLTDVFTQMSTTTVNTNFRLIIIASTTRYLSNFMIMKAKRVNVETFPSIRHSMLSLFQHHSSSIRSTTNPRAMKKLAYASALLMSIMNFRNFVSPVGFSTFVRLNDLSFQDIIEQLRIIIDAHPNDAPLKNLRTQIDQLICAGIGEIHDRKIIAAHAAAMIKTDTLDDGFTITPKTPEKEIWTIPGEIPLANFNQIIQQIPIFSTTEVLHMSSQTLLNWNLSIWCTKPFRNFMKKKKTIDFQNAMMKLDNFVMLMPDKLDISSEADRLMNPVGLFLISEAEKLNQIISFIKSELKRFTHEFMKRIASENSLYFASGKVPKQWEKVSNIWHFTSVNSFASHIIERHAQLMRCIQEGSPVVFDMRLLENPDQLLKTFIMKVALEEGQPVDSLSYQFTIADGTPSVESKSLFLTRLYMANGDFNNGSLSIVRDQNRPPFKQVAALVAKVVRNTAKLAKSFPVPLMKNAIINSREFDSDVLKIENGESKNFVYNISLATDVPEIDLQQFGTCLFCRMPEQFI